MWLFSHWPKSQDAHGLVPFWYKWQLLCNVLCSVRTLTATVKYESHTSWLHWISRIEDQGLCSLQKYGLTRVNPEWGSMELILWVKGRCLDVETWTRVSWLHRRLCWCRWMKSAVVLFVGGWFWWDGTTGGFMGSRRFCFLKTNADVMVAPTLGTFPVWATFSNYMPPTQADKTASKLLQYLFSSRWMSNYPTSPSLQSRALLLWMDPYCMYSSALPEQRHIS